MDTELTKSIWDELDGSDFTIREYVKDGGAAVAARIKEPLARKAEGPCKTETDSYIHCFVKALFLSKIEIEAEKACATRSGKDYHLCFETGMRCHHGTAVIEPKRIWVSLQLEDGTTYTKTSRLLNYSDRIYTILPKKSPASENGLHTAKNLFVQLVYEHLPNPA